MDKKLLLTSLALICVMGVSGVGLTVRAAVNDPVPGDPTLPAGPVAAKAKVARPFAGPLFGGKVLMGKVIGVAEKIITVAQIDGTEADITTTEVTKFIKGGRKITLVNVSEGDQVSALGAAATDGTFLARSIVAKSTLLKELKKAPFFGNVAEVGSKSFTVTNQAKGETVEILVNNQTVIKQTDKKVNLSTIVAGNRVVVIALVEDNGTYTGKMVVVLPDSPAKASAEEKQGTPSQDVLP